MPKSKVDAMKAEKDEAKAKSRAKQEAMRANYEAVKAEPAMLDLTRFLMQARDMQQRLILDGFGSNQDGKTVTLTDTEFHRRAGMAKAYQSVLDYLTRMLTPIKEEADETPITPTED